MRAAKPITAEMVREQLHLMSTCSMYLNPSFVLLFPIQKDFNWLMFLMSLRWNMDLLINWKILVCEPWRCILENKIKHNAKKNYKCEQQKYSFTILKNMKFSNVYDCKFVKDYVLRFFIYNGLWDFYFTHQFMLCQKIWNK